MKHFSGFSWQINYWSHWLICLIGVKVDLKLINSRSHVVRRWSEGRAKQEQKKIYRFLPKNPTQFPFSDSKAAICLFCLYRSIYWLYLLFLMKRSVGDCCSGGGEWGGSRAGSLRLLLTANQLSTVEFSRGGARGTTLSWDKWQNAFPFNIKESLIKRWMS